MLRVTWADIRRHPTRLVGVLLAIMISVGFVAGCLTFVDTEANALRAAITARTANSNLVVQPGDDTSLTSTLRRVPGVGTVEPSTSAYVAFTAGAKSSRMDLTSVPTDQRLRWTGLAAGRWPTAADEIAVSGPTAKAFDLTVGATMIVRVGSAPRTVTVVGVSDERSSRFTDLQITGFAAPGSPLLADGWTQYLVLTTPGTDPEVVAADLRGRLGETATVQTSAEIADQAITNLTNGIDVVRYLLLGFGGIALLVGAIIISTTFATVVAQRRQQIGLLRAIGADRRQIRAQLLIEAVIIGVVGSVAGVALGLGIAAAGGLVTGSLRTGLVVNPLPLALALGVGVLVTVLAVIAPAARAVRVSPLDALRPVADLSTERRAGRVRAIIGLLLVAVGAAVVVVALRTPQHALPLAVVGSAVLAVGILALAPVFLPPLLRLLARSLGRRRPTVRLAAANLVRNPARSATVATALMLGVGLIVTLQVGAASVKASAEASLRSEFPVDITLTSADGPLAATILDQVRSTPGIRAAVPVPELQLELGDDIGSIMVAGLGPDARTVVSSGLDRLDDATALVHPYTLERLRRADGDQLTLRYQGRTVTVTLRTSDVAGGAGSLVLTQTTLARLAPNAPVRSVWAAAAPGADVVAVMTSVQDLAGGQQVPLLVGGSLEQTATLIALLDGLLAAATALTAVAVVIALVGMGTTLGLSVIERSRESALLRALGLQRRQLARMLAVEAMLLAAIGALVGVAAGLLFGFVGAAAMGAEGEFAELRLAVSVPQVLVVVVAAVLAGALASILPGRRAASATPVAALAEA